MSFSRKLRRTVAASGGLVVAGVASAALAGPALAASGATVSASGSSLQKQVQTALTTGTGGYDTLHAGVGGIGVTSANITYNSTSSGDGLAEFGDAAATINNVNFSAGVLNAGANNTNGNGTVLDAFIGTDDQPTSAQIALANTAAGSGSQQVTLPVLQAPVAVDISLPSNISGVSGSIGLTNDLLYKIWSDNVPAFGSYLANSWGALLHADGVSFTEGGTAGSGGAFGTGGFSQIKLQARSDGSGTTFTFRGYLDEVGKLEVAANGSFSNIYSGTVSDSASGWPVTVNESNVSSGNNQGSGGLANGIKNNPGSIGYVNLADSVSAGFTSTLTGGLVYAQVQDNGLDASPQFADPSTDPSSPSTSAANVYVGGNANVTGTYDLTNATSNGVGAWTVPAHANGSWAPAAGGVALADDPNVFNHAGQNPNSLSTVPLYPIVAATFDEVWSSYTAGAHVEAAYGGATAAQSVSNTVTDYFESFVFGSTGQSLINNNGYAVLPSNIESTASSFAGGLTPIS